MDPEPTSNDARRRLMIVDDDAEMRALLAEYFRRLGFDVAEKESGAAALQTVATDRFDCFILDVAMPEMSGIELLKKMRDRGIDTPTLFLTAHDLLDDKVAGFEAGADDYLAKPFSPRELEYRIEALLRRRAGGKQNDNEDRLEIGDLVVDRRRGYQRNIDPHINRLRKKLENDPKDPHYVLTVRGVGYKLNENP